MDKAHNRIEQRTCLAFDAKDILGTFQKDWPWIRTIFVVGRYREELGKKSTISESYYVSNRRNVLAKDGAQYIRRHWDIENKVHYVRDETFREDRATRRKNPFVFSVCIGFVLNILRGMHKTNISKELFYASTIFKDILTKYCEYF
jgi:hypothetical protein